MAKIRDRAQGRTDGGYTRIFGNEQVGALFSMAHATAISAGTELEKIVFNSNVNDLDAFLDGGGSSVNTVNVVTKKVLKESKTIMTDGKEPDAILFLRNGECKIIELKDGDTFDTKKVDGEIKTLEEVTNKISREVRFSVKYYICGFNSKDIDSLKLGLKNRVKEENLMLGEDLCKILGLDYNKILKDRENDSKDNLSFFIDELLKIDEVKKQVEEKLKLGLPTK